MHAASVRYNRVAMILHWLMAFAIIGMIAVGLIMEDIKPVSLRIDVYQIHKSLGLTILFLSVFRLAWRLAHTPPALPATTKPYERVASRISHAVLYVLMIGMPLSGWLMISTSKKIYPTEYFWMFEVPLLPFFQGENKKAAHSFFYESHELLAYGAIALITVHVLAALKHHFVNKDDVLARMMPRCCKK